MIATFEETQVGSKLALQASPLKPSGGLEQSSEEVMQISRIKVALKNRKYDTIYINQGKWITKRLEWFVSLLHLPK